VREILLEARPVVLSAPSGVGKTTIARVLVDREEDFSFSVSATTRPPREGEIDGVDYRFVSEVEFLEMVDRGELAEWAEVHGDFYGTPIESLKSAGRAGRHVVLDIDVQGAMQIREAVPEALLLFILPPSAESLLQRLTGRGTEKEETLRRRLTTAVQELEAAPAFDFFVVNRDLDEAVAEVRGLARKGEAPQEGTSGTLEDARKLLVGIESLLRRGELLHGH
jgi:guanylate kinase